MTDREKTPRHPAEDARDFWHAEATRLLRDLDKARRELADLERHFGKAIADNTALAAEVEARVAAARDEGGREALTGALHPEFGSIYAPGGAATVAHEAGRREGIEAAAREVDCSCEVRDAVLARLEARDLTRASWLCQHGDVCCALQAAEILDLLEDKR